MKQSFRIVTSISALALLTFAIGCASTATTVTKTPDMLMAAGFKPVNADTPEKQKLLNSLPEGQLSEITWKGKKIYVQPDLPNNRAYAGTPAHYQKYRELRLDERLKNDEILAEQMHRDAMLRWSAWNPSIYGGLYGAGFY